MSNASYRIINADFEEWSIWSNITNISNTGNPTRFVGTPFCPDLLSYDDLGAADNLRGRVIRAFFYCIRWWKP